MLSNVTKRQSLLLICRVQIFFAACCMTSLCVAQAANRKSQALPPFNKIDETFRRYLVTADPDYQNGDILSQTQVDPALDAIKQMGWNCPSRKTFLNDVCSDRDFLVEKLRTKKGTLLMRKISSNPRSYDRLHRLSWTPHGKRDIIQMIEGPHGYKVAQTLLSDKDNRAVHKSLSRAARGKNFRKPTGHIYTEDQLVARLKECYERDVKHRKKHAKSNIKLGGQ